MSEVQDIPMIKPEPAFPWLRGPGPRFTVAFIVMTVAAISYLLMTLKSPVLGDYCNHLARIYIDQSLEKNPLLGQFYEKKADFYPWAGMDIVIKSLDSWLDINVAGRIFVVLSVVAPMLSVIFLNWVVWRRLTVWPLTATLFLFGFCFDAGLLNFTFSLAWAIVGLALWIMAAGWPWWQRMVFFLFFSSVVLWLHFLAYFVLAVLIGAHELGRLTSLHREDIQSWIRNLLLTALTVGLPSLLVLIGPHTPISDTPGRNWLDHLWRWLFVTQMSDDMTVSGVELIPVLLLFGFILVVVSGCCAGKLRLHPALRMPLVVSVLITLLVPFGFPFGSDIVQRFPLVVFLLLSASIIPTEMRPGLRWAGVVLLGAGVAIRMATVMPSLWQADDAVSELRNAAAQTIIKGSRVLPVMVMPATGALSPSLKAFWHTAAYLVLDQDIFYPLLFSHLAVKIRPEYQSMAAASVPVPIQYLNLPAETKQQVIFGFPNYWVDWPQKFDYILLYHFGSSAELSGPVVTPLSRGKIFAIYRINR